MRTILFLMLALLPLASYGQPVRAQPFTTNTAPVVTNMIRRIVALYQTPSVVTLVNDQSPVEVGATVTSTLLDWTLAGNTPTAQYLNNGIGSIGAGLLQYNHVQSYTTDRTYTLTVTDGIKTNTASTSVLFQSKAYWGVSALTTLTDAQIRALTQEFATSRLRTKTVSPAAQYIYMIYPAAFGTATFIVGGFADTAWTLEGGAAQNFVNAQGATVSYYVYRSNDTALGTFTVEVQ